MKKINEAEEFYNKGEYQKAKNILHNLKAILSDEQAARQEKLLNPLFK